MWRRGLRWGPKVQSDTLLHSESLFSWLQPEPAAPYGFGYSQASKAKPRLLLTCSKLLHTHTRRRGRRSFDYVTCCISFKPNSRPIKGYPWNNVISRARQRLREAEQGEVCFSHHNYGLDAGWGDGYMKLQQVMCLSFTSHCSPKCSILTHSSSLLPVLRTSTSRTFHPVGVMGWLSVLWFTPSFPPSLTTPLCRRPIAGTTLSWPLELQSEW